MMNSKELWARREEMANKQSQLMNDGMEDEARVVEGQIMELDITMKHILEEEDKLRAEYEAAPAHDAVSFGERILGARDEFDGLQIGFKNTDTTPPVVTVAAPTEVELELPGKGASLLNNFAGTLPSAPAVGSVQYKQRGTQYGAPGTWAGVDGTTGESATKEKVIYTWADATANQETIAGYVPISKPSLRDYDELLSIIESDLLIDLNEATNAKLLTGSNSSGIVGIENTTGIQAFTDAMAGRYYDAIRMMRTLCMKNARRIPTHVCLHPDIKEAIDLYKTQMGLYQFLGDGIMWGMQVVEDFDCEGILVYDAFSAKKRPVHGVSVEVGYVDKQFIQNELCLLAEQSLAFQVVRPNAFVYAEKDDLDVVPSIESE